jgi:hypothetical protein
MRVARVLAILLSVSCLGATCGPPPAPEELPPRFVFRLEFLDPCELPVPGVQFEVKADPAEKRPLRADGSSAHEWRSTVRGQSDEFGEARVDLGTDWGSLVDVHATFAGQISEVRAAPDCFIELRNRAVLQVVLDTYTCAESRARAEKSEDPFVQLFVRGQEDNFRRKHRTKVVCRDAAPSALPEAAAEPPPAPGKPPARGRRR